MFRSKPIAHFPAMSGLFLPKYAFEGKIIMVSYNGQQLIYYGRIDDKGFNYLKELFENIIEVNGLYPSMLSISSNGGYSQTGLSFGKWVMNNNLDVKIGRYCLSSCANYVFIAGKRKLLKKNSILGWHGIKTDQRAIVAGFERAMEEAFADNDHEIFTNEKYGFDKYYKNLKKLDPNLNVKEARVKFIEAGIESSRNLVFDSSEIRAFYDKLGVDIRLPNYGLDELEKLDSSLDGFFYYSIEDLEKMGINNIELVNGSWSPIYERENFFKVDSKLIQ